MRVLASLCWCILVVKASEVTSDPKESPCKGFTSCMRSGLTDMENSQSYPLLGRRLFLERLEDAKDSTVNSKKMSVITRAYRLLETHVVRAPITEDLSLKLFRNKQRQFDVALEVTAPETANNGRTFFKRRLQMALLPIMYKLGVMTTLLGGLVVMVMKGLVIGVILLILAVASAVKHKLLWHDHHGSSWGGATPYVSHSAPQDIHLHLHGVNKEHAISSSSYGAPIIHHRSDYAPSAPSGSGNNGGGYNLSPYNREAHLQV